MTIVVETLGRSRKALVEGIRNPRKKRGHLDNTTYKNNQNVEKNAGLLLLLQLLIIILIPIMIIM